ncbi:lipopolysaccharide kinase InaA family protein [Marinobacter sp. ATCH36]|uniref:lipopolysaccharide kinase InaA family protein n=1 Tax=Marinobacter sp. ATCH36 TaxID=2945106 RepID=UPI002020E7FC|nr:lipopolysaccharide kinase InaA family protein [Marinobacter sp. ATCH36]MCL7945967.1 lipopolysaccharide kinase InaA family protein [Marinobacter sp. ATCH36]
MTTVELQEELHSNTRRTRITYRGLVNGQPAAIKCYRKPLFGLVHWIRALRRGKKIRRAGGPVPPIVFAGWVASARCFGYGTAFLEGYRPLRAVLMAEPSRSRQIDIIRILGRAMADIHKRGIEQPDGNLTNFLMGEDSQLSMVDEDDIRVHHGMLSIGVATSNLANVAARLPDEEMVEILLTAYLDMAFVEDGSKWDSGAFWTSVQGWKKMLESKRASRNITPERKFD